MLEIDENNSILFNQIPISKNSNLKTLISSKKVGEVFYIPNLEIGNSIEANTYELVGIKYFNSKNIVQNIKKHTNQNENQIRKELKEEQVRKQVKKDIKDDKKPKIVSEKKTELKSKEVQKCIDINSKFKIQNIKTNEIEEYQFVNNKLKQNLIENIVFTGSLMFKNAKGKKVGDIFEIETIKPSGASNVEHYKILEIF